ncbi:hypothetical protein Zm00014a_013543 [Zea mays]|nr:hypothetical protein Zm00014a_013543 [Zea mays]PWZ45226.1 hypothetical protein Zm00014a_013543 [Zea mays]PWZ45227.1 hypothetical protein Zm00014a_013543 [Zea mays]
MVCMVGNFKMSSVLKLVMMENHATPDDVIHEMTAAQVLQKQLFDAHEPNLLDENDMHIFGSKPMADPLDLVCCSTCKKPVKASQYAIHTGLGLSVDSSVTINVPKNHPRDAPVPLATKMYHSQGNYRLRFELGQLYRESCVQHLSGHTTPNVSHENGLMASSRFSSCGNSALPTQKSLVPQTKPLANPQQLAASRPNQSQGTKTERASAQASAIKNEGSRSRCNKATIPHSRNKGWK